VNTESTTTDPRKHRSAEDFDVIIGFLGFWALLLVVVTVVLEVTGQPALIPDLILLVVVLAIWGMLRLRKSLPARTARRPR
jgi:H+/Cl- antiporter ClcA